MNKYPNQNDVTYDFDLDDGTKAISTQWKCYFMFEFVSFLGLRMCGMISS